MKSLALLSVAQFGSCLFALEGTDIFKQLNNANSFHLWPQATDLACLITTYMFPGMSETSIN